MIDSPPKQEPPYGLRMPPELKSRVKAAAEANNRSMNAEIVATLEEKYPALNLHREALLRVARSLLRAPADQRSSLVEMMMDIAKGHPDPEYVTRLNKLLDAILSLCETYERAHKRPVGEEEISKFLSMMEDKWQKEQLGRETTSSSS
ncbi:Arc family DNA-binding protein [Thioclava sp. BHET1]|nr:Arc family DNA-binding protein [Thioclava sp. BHET1]